MEAGTAATSLVSSDCTARSSAWTSRRSAPLSSCLCFFFFVFFSSLLFWKTIDSVVVRLIQLENIFHHLNQPVKQLYQLTRLGQMQAVHRRIIHRVWKLTFRSLSLSFFFSCFSLLLFFLGSCEAASPSSIGLFGASAARCARTGSFSLSARGLAKQQHTADDCFIRLSPELYLIFNIC